MFTHLAPPTAAQPEECSALVKFAFGHETTMRDVRRSKSSAYTPKNSQEYHYSGKKLATNTDVSESGKEMAVGQ
jgi:hypothetical protein